MRRSVLALGFASAALLALLFTDSVGPLSAQGSGFLRLPSMEPTTLNPARVTYISDVNISSQLFAGLTQLDRSNAVVPSIALTWTTSPDARVWTFSLRDDAFFHNGRQVKAGDFVSSWNWAKGAGGAYAGWLDKVSYAATDDFSLVITLTQGAVDFAAELMMPIYSVVPVESVATIATAPVGSGPFTFVSWTPGDRLVLAANPAYFDGAPGVNGIEYVFYPVDPAGLRQPNAALQWPDYLAGKLDVSHIPTTTWPLVRDDPGVVTGTVMATRMIGFDAAAFPDVRVRRAFQMAVDREAIAASPSVWAYDGPVPLADGVVSPRKGSYDNSDLAIAYDASGALALLAVAGWIERDADGVLENEAGAHLQMTLQSSAGHRPVAIMAADNLRNIGGSGLGVSVTVTSTAAGSNARLLSWYSDFPDPANDLLPFATGQQYANYLHYSSPTFDALLAAARVDLDVTERNAGYHAAEAQLLITDAAVLPICNYLALPMIAVPAVQGLYYQGTRDGALVLTEVTMRSLVYLPLVLRVN